METRESGGGVFVWVDSWQHQCCGQDFAVGSDVVWEAVAVEESHGWVELILGEEWAKRVRFHQESHHDEGAALVLLEGVVHSIREVTCGRTADPQAHSAVRVPIPGAGMLTQVPAADKWRPEPPEEDCGDLSFEGWIVELETGRRST
jgi:hypothetical protein